MNQITKRPSLFPHLSELHQALDQLFEPNWFDRENWLPNVVGTRKVGAKTKNRVLEIIVPKIRETQAQKIHIKEE